MPESVELRDGAPKKFLQTNKRTSRIHSQIAIPRNHAQPKTIRFSVREGRRVGYKPRGSLDYDIDADASPDPRRLSSNNIRNRKASMASEIPHLVPLDALLQQFQSALNDSSSSDDETSSLGNLPVNSHMHLQQAVAKGGIRRSLGVLTPQLIHEQSLRKKQVKNIKSTLKEKKRRHSTHERRSISISKHHENDSVFHIDMKMSDGVLRQNTAQNKSHRASLSQLRRCQTLTSKGASTRRKTRISKLWDFMSTTTKNTTISVNNNTSNSIHQTTYQDKTDLGTVDTNNLSAHCEDEELVFNDEDNFGNKVSSKYTVSPNTREMDAQSGSGTFHKIMRAGTVIMTDNSFQMTVRDQIVENKYFEPFILTCIVLNSVMLAIQNPHKTDNSAFGTALNVMYCVS